MTDALRPWTIDFHVAQNDGQVHGTGSHDKTAATARPTTPTARSTSSSAAGYWLEETEATPRLNHICWDGCMFPNAMLETANLEHDPRCDDQGAQRARVAVKNDQ